MKPTRVDRLSNDLAVRVMARIARNAKETRDGETLSRVTPLDDAARIEEIARMLGGVNITDTTRSHAAEMLGLTG